MLVLTNGVCQRNRLAALQVINRFKEVQSLEHGMLALAQLHKPTSTIHSHGKNDADAGDDQCRRRHEIAYLHQFLTHPESMTIIPPGRVKLKKQASFQDLRSMASLLARQRQVISRQRRGD